MIGAGLAALLVVCGCERPVGFRLDRLPPVEVYFSPQGGATSAVVREIEQAQESIRVQAYSFTSPPIAQALVAAHRRGLRVEVLLDLSQRSQKYTSADFLVHAGVPVRIDARHAIAHNKVMILDEKVVITGSFNFTRAAEENNAENLLVIRDPQLAAIYLQNWQAHAEHSEGFSDRSRPGEPSKSRGSSARPTESAPADAEEAKAPPVRSEPANGYFASRNSSVFHRATCPLASKIAVHNRVPYADRETALAAGKKPCQDCCP